MRRRSLSLDLHLRDVFELRRRSLDSFKQLSSTEHELSDAGGGDNIHPATQPIAAAHTGRTWVTQQVFSAQTITWKQNELLIDLYNRSIHSVMNTNVLDLLVPDCGSWSESLPEWKELENKSFCKQTVGRVTTAWTDTRRQDLSPQPPVLLTKEQEQPAYPQITLPPPALSPPPPTLWERMTVTERGRLGCQWCHPESLMSPPLCPAPGVLPECDALPLTQPASVLAAVVKCIMGSSKCH